MAVRRAMGDPVRIARAMHNLGMLAYHDDDDQAAERWLEAAAARERELGDDRVLGSTLANLGRVKALLGDYDAAKAHGEEGIALARARRDRLDVLNLEASLGVTLAEAGDPEGRALLERCAARAALSDALGDDLAAALTRGAAFGVHDLAFALTAERSPTAA